MRNMVIVTLSAGGVSGWRVAEVFGLTPTYVARLKSAAARDGAAALAGQDGPGRPRALGEDEQDLARQWRAQGESIWRSAGGWGWRGPRWPAESPRVARALALLIDEINHTPPAMPGDTRPIIYQFTAYQPGSNK